MKTIIFALALLVVCCFAANVRVSLRGGEFDPVFTITNSEYEILTRFSRTTNNVVRHSNRAIGYNGFVVEENWLIFNNPIAENYLLELAATQLSSTIIDHIHEVVNFESDAACGIQEEKCFYDENCCNGYSCENGICAEENESFATNFWGRECHNTPIVGPDTVPVFSPKTDCDGCFVKDQEYNNCYAYGSDIVTDTFPKPGRGTGQKFSVNTCKDVKDAAVRDGLTWIGQKLPSSQPKVGHWIALLIWPNENFHWARKDTNELWSHKPGRTPIRTTDNSGRVIKDPSTADFRPWSEFCGYMHVIPSNVTIS
eukprot:TRINITY_DN774107_c0_g1_i1.p1 TRINITY_DN774107_c0_g1~~TRINITY_DN774107_c0_g1_i1.p1  ORF type:complete len:312 (-),score=66.21 TRINITY_DN774107_c0_g1_i1:250-1185(-)